ncbi:MAG: hypothetical protein NVSMB14_15850 [Isosphaeraceae bacterium]
MKKMDLFKELDRRRLVLGLSHETLSKRCGVSRPTVQRILSGRHPNASFANIASIVESLGLAIHLDSEIDPRELKEKHAERKAKRLVALVQGTSGLEGQAVDDQTVESMVRRTTRELLSGSNRKLWSKG